MLLAFEAAARLGSFTKAAKELHQTQGAISRQVAAMEHQLDVCLFERQHKTLVLSDAGQRYANEIRPALGIIRNASLNAMSNVPSGLLNLAILPTFGTRWIMPRLPSFLTQHPNINVNFVTRLAPFDFAQENLHAAIHYGHGDWAGAQCTFLMHEQTVPVCSQKFLDQHPMQCAKDISEQPLLGLASRDSAWRKWLEYHQVISHVEPAMSFEEISTLTQAAVSGLGVALLPTFLIEPELSSQQLVILNDTPAPSYLGYYLVTPLVYADYAPIKAFRQWLINAMANT
ncbi:Transcriptional regulator, LysR family [gamma proteobacterium IMCC1989]|nr:Transcriptional regulator, LysR family [gamma proteobacterium IMCC1989]